jgi:hypothetical protein
MSDLIKREDATKALRERWARTTSYDGIGEDIGEECEEVIKAIPSADRPQGEWELVGERTQYRRCPYCKRTRAFQDTRFCDWCGARMKGADDE